MIGYWSNCVAFFDRLRWCFLQILQIICRGEFSSTFFWFCESFNRKKARMEKVVRVLVSSREHKGFNNFFDTFFHSVMYLGNCTIYYKIKDPRRSTGMKNLSFYFNFKFYWSHTHLQIVKVFCPILIKFSDRKKNEVASSVSLVIFKWNLLYAHDSCHLVFWLLKRHIHTQSDSPEVSGLEWGQTSTGHARNFALSAKHEACTRVSRRLSSVHLRLHSPPNRLVPEHVVSVFVL